MITLPNGCWCSGTPADLKRGIPDFLPVFPKNWATSKTITQDWYIQYYFHDPVFSNDPKYKNGKLVIVKAGINRHKDPAARREALLFVMEGVLHALQVEGFNPITKQKNQPAPEIEYPADPSTPLTVALAKALELSDMSHEAKIDVKSILNYISPAAARINLASKPVGQVSRRDLVLLLDATGKAKGDKWTKNNYNHYRRYLSALFTELEKIEAVLFNPVEKIPKKAVKAKKRQILTDKEREDLDTKLKKDDYYFWRYLQLFFHSGARLIEMQRLKTEDINLESGVISNQGRKGYEGVIERPIKYLAVYLWMEVLSEAKPGQYLFGKGFQPADRPMVRSTVTHHWQAVVKIGYGIDKDIYSVRHLALDEIAKELGLSAAAQAAGHTTTAMVAKHYAVNEAERQMTKIRNLNTALVPDLNRNNSNDKNYHTLAANIRP